MRVEVALDGAMKLDAAMCAASGAIISGLPRILDEEGQNAARWLHDVLLVSEYEGGRFSPSSPGEPPHSRNGALAQSIVCEVETGDDGSSALALGSEKAYAPYLEHGTGKMAARPFLLPAFEQLAQAVEERLENLVREAGL